MSNEGKWANWSELGAGSLKNFDPARRLTIYQFVIEYQGMWQDKYIQAHTLKEAQQIYLDQAEADEIDLEDINVYSIMIPANDVLDKLTRKAID